jgi:alkylated DNA repair dioxygenase AlkB
MNVRPRPAALAQGEPQLDLFRAQDALPAGFRQQAAIIDPAEEAALAERLAALDFQPFDFHGYLANRRVVGFDLRYDYGRRAMIEAPPIPNWLQPLRDKVGAFAGRPAEAFVQVLINEYAPGAGIGWHRDKPQFDEVVGVSLMAACTFRFRRKTGETWTRRSLSVEPRSAYLLSGPSRTEWEHSIPPLAAPRYSITFRTLASGRP